MCGGFFLQEGDFECPSFLAGCGTQHPHRALGGTRVLLAAAPITPPCFRRWRRSSSLLGINSGNSIFIVAFVALCGALQTHFSREGLGTNSLSQNLTVLPAPSGREPLAHPDTLHFSGELCHHAKGPIPEGAVERMRDWGSLTEEMPSPSLLPKSPSRENGITERPQAFRYPEI